MNEVSSVLTGQTGCGMGHVFQFAGSSPIPTGWPCICGLTKYNQPDYDALAARLATVEREHALDLAHRDRIIQEHITKQQELTQQLAQAQGTVTRLRDHMQNIAEYWNGDENDRAMADSCHRVVEIAEQALRETEA